MNAFWIMMLYWWGLAIGMVTIGVAGFGLVWAGDKLLNKLKA